MVASMVSTAQPKSRAWIQVVHTEVITSSDVCMLFPRVGEHSCTLKTCKWWLWCVHTAVGSNACTAAMCQEIFHKNRNKTIRLLLSVSLSLSRPCARLNPSSPLSTSVLAACSWCAALLIISSWLQLSEANTLLHLFGILLLNVKRCD